MAAAKTQTAPAQNKMITVEEVMEILQVGKSTAYHVMQRLNKEMGARLGLRIGDMLNLTMNDIDWENKLISIIQGKTKEPLTLPLPDDVGWALINYLKNDRPETDCPNIFVVHNAPYKGSPFKSTLRHNISKILKRAGISVDRSRHYGWHSLRHSDPQVAKHYLRVDLDGLAKCALEVEVMDYVRQ